MNEGENMSLSEYINELPNICGSESQIQETIQNHSNDLVFLPDSAIDFSQIKSAFTIALHMHQPMIPAGGGDLQTAAMISNLKYMMDNQHIGDNHNAPVFHHCYKRIAEFIPQLFDAGKQPRVMLEYSGTLLHGLRHMGLHDVLDSLKYVTNHPKYRQGIEWLGCPWGHAVAPSTPIQDYRLHVRAWQHHFAAIFGLEALARIRGFSPSEMALPNHPDIAYEFVKTLKDCGYQWVLVQEHTVELADGHGLEHKHLPHLLTCINSEGESVSIIALIKTQGSDTKLVAQMQPYYEAISLQRVNYKQTQLPPLVTQIADGENGGVMMNEFPGKFSEVMSNSSYSETPAMNGTEYLEHFFAHSGLTEQDLPVIQPIMQSKIWDRFKPGSGADKLARTIDELKKEDHRFHMDGGSWTNDISWVNGYEDVLSHMEKASSLFHEKVLAKNISPADERYRNALFHLMMSQTSCYRYWGQGLWTDYGREICRRTSDIINYDFVD
jgi:hypothetical protein